MSDRHPPETSSAAGGGASDPTPPAGWGPGYYAGPWTWAGEDPADTPSSSPGNRLHQLPPPVPPGWGPGATQAGLQPYRYGPPVVSTPGALPDGPREYQHLLRGPRYRWWRALVALALVVGLALAAQLLAFIPLALSGAASGVDNLGTWMSDQLNALVEGRIGPAGFLYINLGLAALIPAAGLSVWIAHHIRPRYLSSVVGGIRWRWLARCVLILLPLWAVYLGLGFFLDPPQAARPEQWVLLMVLVVFTTPFQAAGEEYVFRGWIMQNVGGWFRNPMVGLVAAIAVSAATFALAHGSLDPWILASIAVFAVSACLATWRTGGLEAAIAIHAVNNVGAMLLTLTFGGWDQAFISGDSEGSPLPFLFDVAVQAAALALIWWQAKRQGVQRLYQPVTPPA